MNLTAAEVFDDFNTYGVPSSGYKQPKKSEIRKLLTQYEGILLGIASSGGLVYGSYASLAADLTKGANTMGWVIGDLVVANNGIYRKIGAANSGSWTRVADLPFSLIIAADLGTGTPNAINAASIFPVSQSALVWLTVNATNTASPVTVSFNGGSALTIKTNSGNNIAPGGLVAGMAVLGIVVGSTLRLLSDQASAAIQAAAEAAKAAAEAARDATIAAMSSVVPNIFATKAVASLYAPTVAPNFIQLAGYAATGDGGGALYKKVASEPTHLGKFSITLSGGATTWFEIAEREITPLHLGVARNSGADQTAGLQAWLDVIAALNIDGYVPRGVYKLDGELTSSSDSLRVRCHKKTVFDATAAPAGRYSVSITGSIGAFANITVGNAQEGATRIRSTTSFATSLAIGDVIKIKSADVYDASNTSMLFGELNVVTGLADAATGYIDVERPLSATYVTSPQVAKITPVRDLTWEGGYFLGAVAEQNGQRAIRLKHTRHFRVDGVSVERMDDRAFWIEDCLDGEIARPNCFDARPTSTGYGVSVIDACQDINIHHGKFQRYRHSFSTNNQTSNGGIPRRITFADNEVSGGALARGGSMGPGDAIDTHGAAEDIYIERNTVTGSPGQGINFECRSGVIRDNKVIRPASNGISIHNESDFDGAVICSGNRVLGAGGKGIYAVNGTRGTVAKYVSMIIADNSVADAAGEGIQVGYATQSQLINGLVMHGNRVRNCSGTGIYILKARRLAVGVNNIDGKDGFPALRLYDCVGFSVTGNSISLPNASANIGIQVTATSPASSTWGTIIGNTVSPESGSFSGAGVALDNNAQQVGVFGNTLRGTAGVALGTGTGNAQANNIT